MQRLYDQFANDMSLNIAKINFHFNLKNLQKLTEYILHILRAES